MRKILSLLVIAMMVVALVGCGVSEAKLEANAWNMTADGYSSGYLLDYYTSYVLTFADGITTGTLNTGDWYYDEYTVAETGTYEISGGELTIVGDDAAVWTNADGDVDEYYDTEVVMDNYLGWYSPFGMSITDGVLSFWYGGKDYVKEEGYDYFTFTE